MNGDESVGDAREPRRGALRTAVRRYRDDLVHGANDGIFTTPSRVDDAAQQQHRQPPQRHRADRAMFRDALEPSPALVSSRISYAIHWTPPSMAESQLAELQNMRRRRKDQRVRARGHGVPAQVSTNGPLVLCGCERRSASIPGGRTGRRVSAYPRSSTGGRDT